MGKIYNWEVNPFRDYLLTMVMMDIDISDKKIKNEINTYFTFILENLLMNGNDAVHLDFEIINIGNHFKVSGNNSVSAMWLSGLIPNDTESALKNNTFIVKNKRYVFDVQTKELTYTIIHE
jgi:hypothetical protein